MKRMFLVKLMFVLVGLIFVYGYDQRNIAAEEAGCNTSTTCGKTASTGMCYCTEAGPGKCKGCFIPDNETGCGTCSTGGGDLEIQ